MNFKKIILASVLITAMVCPAPANGNTIWPFKKKQKTEQKDTAATKKSKYEKLFEKEKKVAKGFITVHLKDGKVYFEIADSLLGREMVMGSTIKSISDNANGIVGSKDELIHFTFTKSDSTIQMRQLTSDYITDDSNIEKALSRSTIGAVLRNMKIKAYGPDSSYVFDVTDIFLSDDKKMSPFLDNSLYSSYSRDDSFKKDLSFIVDAKAFEDNISVTSSLSYSYTLKSRTSGKKLLKDQPFTAQLTRSILLLPKKIYHPRMADPRIGYFFTERDLFSSQQESSKPVFFANRWRLEPSDTAAYRQGKLVEPVKPIVYYIDSNFPEWWKPYVRKAVGEWNQVFEEIGFKNAIVVKDFPTDDPSFDPDNIKYNCVRYAPIGIANSMGPSWVDPRSGEIINASVYIYHDVIKLLTTWIFVQTSQADPDVRTCNIPKAILGDALEYVVRHELGHTLGLMHNMSASSVIPVDSLRSPSFTEKYGTTTSIMDYARFNYVAQPGDKERGVKLTPPTFGTYDKWAIRWGYTPVFDAGSFKKETEITKGWITDSLKKAPFYRYGKQQLYSIFFDPRCQNEDLGNDVMKASEYGIKNLKYIMSNYMNWINDKDDPEYKFRTQIFMGILNQYLRYIQHLMANVGGLCKNEVIAGDSTKRYMNIPGAKQKAIMEYVMQQYKDLEWMDDKAVLSKLPIIGKPSFAVRNAMQSIMMTAPYYASLSDGVATKEYSYEQCLDDIFDFVWTPTKRGRRLSAGQRELQTDFVNNYMSMGSFKKPGDSDKLAATELEALEDGDFNEESFESGDNALSAGLLKYSPVSGFEWLPRYVMNSGEMSKGSIYGILRRAYDLMKAHKNTASAEDKAHYELLMKTIEYSVK
ncbi:MAG: zinc-dependent metalloprotease [Bacteroidales bacterium]|jgi:hypothetical protein|nr:zinc-dependent metalloprotease [Bacteroidales bacterium]MCI1784740.1 zinc-dependent metalloprotease [Bacteroidales bacterium]